MTTTTEALKIARDALAGVDSMHSRYCDRVAASEAWAANISFMVRSAIAAIDAIAQPQPSAPSVEPAAWAVLWGLGAMRMNSVHIERTTAEQVAARIKSNTEVRPLIFSAAPLMANGLTPQTAAPRICRVIAKGGKYTRGLYENPSPELLLAFEFDGDAVEWLSPIGASALPANIPSTQDTAASVAVISKLDPNEDDPGRLWAEIARLCAALKGPDGYATWQDAATAERVRRVRAERAAPQAAPVSAPCPTWQDAERISNLHGVDEAIRVLIADSTADNATGAVLAILQAARASAPAVAAPEPARPGRPPLERATFLPLYDETPLPAREPLTDAQAETLIENSDGGWHDGEFRIDGPGLMRLLRAAAAAPAAQSSTKESGHE